MTEHGVLAAECGVNDDPGAWTLKTKCALRSYCLWLHTGIDVLHFFAAWDKEAGQFGLLPVDLPALPADARFDEVAPPPLKALRALTRPFEGAGPLKKIRPLEVEAAPVGEARKIFDGVTPLRSSDALVVLPWQKTDTEYVLGLYVMTWDGAATWPEERFRLTLRGASAGKVGLIDPVSGREIAVRVLRQEPGLLDLELPLVDTPRLLTLKP
jgi:hypothetical protein